jgi:hypothetical protein
MNRLDLDPYYARFNNLADRIPEGRMEPSKSEKIHRCFCFPLKKDRLCLEGLNKKIRIHALLSSKKDPYGWYCPVKVKIDGQIAKVLVLPASIRSSLNVPEREKMFSFIQFTRLFRQRQLFSQEKEEEILLEGVDGEDKELFDKIGRIARENNCSVRLSKIWHDLDASVDVFRNGFIAIKTKEKYPGWANNKKDKVATTPTGERVYRRTEKIDHTNPLSVERALRKCAISDLFADAGPGIVKTYAADIYRNRKGEYILIYIQSEYERTLFHLIACGSQYDKRLDRNAIDLERRELPSEEDRIKMGHDLLRGCQTISKNGSHRFLSPGKIRWRKIGQTFEAGISGLQSNFQQERAEWQVVHMGMFLCYLFQKKLDLFPCHNIKYDDENAEFDIDRKIKVAQEDFDRVTRNSEFSPEINELMRGMLQVDPEKRWSLERCIAHFEKCLPPKKPFIPPEEEKRE